MIRNKGSMKSIICFLLLGAFTLAAADLTGKWAGSFAVTNSGGQKTDTALMNLKLSGKAVTGTVGPNASEQMAIRNGKLEGSKLTFDVENDGESISFDLVFDGDAIRGIATGKGPGSQQWSAKLDLKRTS
jgi:hypothetical protein